MSDMKPVSSQVIWLVNNFLDTERCAVEKYDNREPFDSSGTWNLHALAREIYAAGWSDGYTASSAARQGEPR